MTVSFADTSLAIATHAEILVLNTWNGSFAVKKRLDKFLLLNEGHEVYGVLFNKSNPPFKYPRV